jgi:receptor protein-tyrosine kinase
MELRDYLRILQEKWWIVLAAFVATIVATAVFTFMQTPTYRATATYVVAPTGSYVTGEGMVDVLDAMSRRAEIAGTYVSVATSQEIKRQAADELGLSETIRDSISVESRLIPDTNVIEITVEGSNPQLVKIFADAVGINTASYVQKLYEAYGLTALDPARFPESPARPRTMVNLALGTILGLVLGAGLAFLFDYLDTTLRTPQEIEAIVNLPTFAQIPIARGRRRGLTHSLNGDPMQAEAFLRLRTRILAQEQKMPRTLLVTSAVPAEGKSTVVAHLAAAMARSGRQVVAVDADLRRPTLHRFFDLDNRRGLADVLEGRATLDEMVESTRVPGLRVLPSGQTPPAPVVDLLDSPHMEVLLQELGEECDLILVDTPAWLSVTDAAVLAPMADAVLLVVSCAQATEKALRTVRQQLTDIKARVAGMVVNQVGRDGNYYYYKYQTQQEPLSTSDPLTKISGIGPAYERTLNRLGIRTFEQLAKQNPEELAERMSPYAGARRLIRDGWIEQAQALLARKVREPLSPEASSAGQDRGGVKLLFRTLERAVRPAKRQNGVGKQDNEPD